MLFTCTENNKGLKIDPCGTPQSILVILEYLFHKLIWVLLLER